MDKPFPNGESYKDVEKRIKNFLDDLQLNYAGKSVAIIAHPAPQIVLEVIINKKTYQQAFIKQNRLQPIIALFNLW